MWRVVGRHPGGTVGTRIPTFTHLTRTLIPTTSSVYVETGRVPTPFLLRRAYTCTVGVSSPTVGGTHSSSTGVGKRRGDGASRIFVITLKNTFSGSSVSFPTPRSIMSSVCTDRASDYTGTSSRSLPVRGASSSPTRGLSVSSP